MQYIICAISLVFICLGANVVQGFLSGSSLLVQNVNNKIKIANTVNRMMSIKHCKSW
jgi:hypothetical protein